MKPIAEVCVSMQSESAIDWRFHLPLIDKLLKDIDKIENLKHCDPLKSAVLNSLRERFSDYQDILCRRKCQWCRCRNRCGENYHRNGYAGFKCSSNRNSSFPTHHIEQLLDTLLSVISNYTRHKCCGRRQRDDLGKIFSWKGFDALYSAKAAISKNHKAFH